jgi:tRNA-Thr(GGU) m(6)t(6)A37 methyltransferase TsaA
MDITFKPIGVIHTPFTEPGNTPIQGCFAPEARGSVELQPEYAPGLKDLEGFSYIWLLYCFHRAAGYDLLTKPFLDKEKKGVFATRYFRRPNSLGMSLVCLEGIEGSTLKIAGVDMLDGTPLLDIKPYMPLFDNREGAQFGWFATASELYKYGGRPSGQR